MTVLLLLAGAALVVLVVRRWPDRPSRPLDTDVDIDTGGPLERRYRQLLGWYPPEHRQVHAEEMIGVLMAGAEPDRARPGFAQTVDLFLGGMRIRLRPGRALSDRDGWREALAMFSVAAPVLALASVGLSYWATQKWAAFPGLNLAVFYLVLYGQVLVVPLVLLQLRWVAAAVAAMQALTVAVLLTLAVGGAVRWSGTVVAGSAVLIAPSLAVLGALLASPGPRRGLELLRLRHWVCMALAVVPTALLLPTFFYRRFWQSGAGPLGSALLPATAAAGGFLLLLLLVGWLSSAAGKRLVLLFAGLAYPYLLGTVMISDAMPQQAEVLASIPVALLLGAVVFALIRRVRPRPHNGGSPPGPQESRAA